MSLVSQYSFFLTKYPNFIMLRSHVISGDNVQSADHYSSDCLIWLADYAHTHTVPICLLLGVTCKAWCFGFFWNYFQYMILSGTKLICENDQLHPLNYPLHIIVYWRKNFLEIDIIPSLQCVLYALKTIWEDPFWKTSQWSGSFMQIRISGSRIPFLIAPHT